MKSSVSTQLTLLLASSALIITSGTAAPNSNPRIAPPQSSSHGRSYSEWAAAWWQWTYSIPAAQNPVADPTGTLAAVGQTGPVWFLAGNFGGTTVRNVTVPAGKGLFFPVINSLWINLPDFGDNPWSDAQRDLARSIIGPFVDNGFNLSCTIDGVPVADLGAYRTQTADGSEYLITVPDDNITGFLPAGTYGPSVDDGIYLMVAPPKAGKHTIHITAASTGSALGDFALDVTYHLTVK
jgi:hypothetical protein